MKPEDEKRLSDDIARFLVDVLDEEGVSYEEDGVYNDRKHVTRGVELVRSFVDGLHPELDSLSTKTRHKKGEILTALIKAFVEDVESGRVTETTSLVRRLSLEARGAIVD